MVAKVGVCCCLVLDIFLRAAGSSMIELTVDSNAIRFKADVASAKSSIRTSDD